MSRKLFISIALVAFASSSFAQDVSHCVAIDNPDDRLNCFDQAFIETAHPEVAPESAWNVRIDRSALDDSTSVYLSVTSDRPLRSRFGRSADASFHVRCLEGTTSAFVNFGGHFMSEIEGRGRVDYRVDDRQPSNAEMRVSSNNQALGLWRDDIAIPFIRRIIDGNSLYVRAIPYGESALEMTFPIAGLDEAIAPLREACGW